MEPRSSAPESDKIRRRPAIAGDPPAHMQVLAQSFTATQLVMWCTRGVFLQTSDMNTDGTRPMLFGFVG